jgi:precorrin-6B methylase 2
MGIGFGSGSLDIETTIQIPEGYVCAIENKSKKNC